MVALIIFLWIVLAIAGWWLWLVARFLFHKPTKRKRYRVTQRKSISLHLDLISMSGGATMVGSMQVQNELWIATAEFGGMQFRGTRADSAVTAIQALLLVLSNPGATRSGEPDPVLGFSLLLEDTTIQDVMSGTDKTPALESKATPRKRA